jgi:hypothetical protein
MSVTLAHTEPSVAGVGDYLELMNRMAIGQLPPSGHFPSRA